MRPEECDPIPIGVFLDYTDWFCRCKGLDVDQRLVTVLSTADGAFVASMDDGSTIIAEKVLAAPGVRHFANLPGWHTEVPPPRRGHTSDIVSFDGLAGARVVIIGGRQSEYEWAALLCEHGAEHVDVVHRQPVPDFAKVSWAFVEAYIASTLAQRGRWRRLPGPPRLSTTHAKAGSVERGGELAVPVADQEPKLDGRSSRPVQQLADPAPAASLRTACIS